MTGKIQSSGAFKTSRCSPGHKYWIFPSPLPFPGYNNAFDQENDIIHVFPFAVEIHRKTELVLNHMLLPNRCPKMFLSVSLSFHITK
jgi:hypothetical protein